MRFRKIKYNGKKVHLEWSTDSGDAVIEHTLDCESKPEQDLPDAMQAFVPQVVDLLELAEGYDEGLRVTGISINYESSGRRGVVITSLKELDDFTAPLVLNTPHLKEPDLDDDDSPSWPGGWEELLKAAEAAAKGYVEGKRQPKEQPELFDQQDEADEMELATV